MTTTLHKNVLSCLDRVDPAGSTSIEENGNPHQNAIDAGILVVEELPVEKRRNAQRSAAIGNEHLDAGEPAKYDHRFFVCIQSSAEL